MSRPLIDIKTFIFPEPEPKKRNHNLGRIFSKPLTIGKRTLIRRDWAKIPGVSSSTWSRREKAYENGEITINQLLAPPMTKVEAGSMRKRKSR